MNKFSDLKSFECKEMIGKGTFEHVYLVNEIGSNKKCVAKILATEMKEDPTDPEQFIDLYREIKLMSSLNHPSVLRFIGYSPTDFDGNFHPTIITEFAPNGSLRKIIDDEVTGLSRDGWDMTKKLINIYGIANGMKYIHSHSILHRDL